MLATGTYPCVWTYRDQAASGEIRLEGSRAPRGEILDAPGVWTMDNKEGGSFPRIEDVEVLRGGTRNGLDVVLLGARLNHYFPSQTAVRARMAVTGRSLPNNLLFNSVEFQVGGLTELAGVYPLKRVDIPRDLNVDAVASATWNADVARQSWSTSDGDELKLYFNANIAHRSWYGFSLTSAPVVAVSGAPRSAEEWMRQYVRPLVEITTFARARPQSISWVMLHHGVKEFPVQLFGSEITQQPYDAEPTEISELISHDSGTLIHLGPQGASLPDLFAGWQSLQTDYVTFFDYLAVALRDKMSIKSRFLALVPALEGFHVVKYGDGPLRRGEFRKQRKDVIGRIKALNGINDDDVQFVKKWLNLFGSHQLEDRLRELVEHEIGEGLRERIRTRVDPLPEVLSGLVNNPQDVWAVMGTARNRIAHGDDNQPSPDQLAALTHLAHAVAIGVALNHLGIPDTVLCAALDQGQWSLI